MNKRLIKTVLTSILILIAPTILPKKVGAQAVTDINVLSNTVRVYEKYEVRFNVSTSASNYFFSYDPNPPAGVVPGEGVSVDGIITTPSGKVLRHPAFFMKEVENIGSTTDPRFVETNKSYWVLRFSPMEEGNHQVSIEVRDSKGLSITPVGSFTATSPQKPGFIRVSQSDLRYFEFTNGNLHWPIGPAWLGNSNAYTDYLGTGLNFERVWMAGKGAYSTNWARWISSAEQHGNEGFATRFNFQQKAPGSELSYEIIYPQGYRIWIACWLNEDLCQNLEKGKTYEVKLRIKTANIVPSNPASPYGLFIKTHDWWSINDPITTQIRQRPNVISPISDNADWRTITATFTPPDESDDISIFFDNVTSGEAYIDEFSIKEILPGGARGGELIRGSKADLHKYVDPRGAAYFDWQLEQAEKNGVYIQYVVHDKNDWIQNHLNLQGQFVSVENSDGYYQPEDTKACWLLRQWYRYLIARWGYSTAVRGWELNNEGPPPNPDIEDINEHMKTAQAFAQFMHQNDSHPHLASTSFWCCWRPNSWKHPSMTDLNYADLHDYITTNGSALQEFTGQTASAYDEVDWMIKTNQMILDSQVGKPSVRGETGLGAPGETVFNQLDRDNPGIWYHNLLWVQLHPGAFFDPNYWWSQHMDNINRQAIATPFYNFVKTLDLNRGGYTDANAQSENPNLRVIGQKHPAGRAVLWLQNKAHTWKNVMDGVNISPISTTVTLSGFNPNTTYTLTRYNTYTGTSTTESVIANSQGIISFAVTNLSNDIAIKIGDFPEIPAPISPTATPTPTLTPTPTPVPGDANGDGRVDGIDYVVWLNNYNTQTPNGQSSGDFNGDGRVDGIDYVIWLNNYGV